jgi:scytalone dehydratase
LTDLSQDWSRLQSIIAPTLFVDYTAIGKSRWEAMPASDFMAMVTDDDFLGDPTIQTQHLIGASRWVKMSDSFVIGIHQLRAAHQVYTDAELKVIKLRATSHATNEHYYRKMPDGVWKFAGLKPTVRWNEAGFEKVFKGSFKARL